ncbi:MAG: endolytic transglycosylase MltG [Actinobacteria bacterium]|nr:endolytic transglycosylase MltG [Actinomycetota bacterium]
MNSKESVPSKAKKSTLLGVFTIAGIFLVLGLWVIKGVLPPADYRGSGEQITKIKIAKGQTVSQIANILKAQGVISSVDRFVGLCADTDTCSQLQPGIYRIRTKLPVAAALSALFDPTNRIYSGLLIREGLRNSEIISLLSQETKIPESEFVVALKSPQKVGLPTWAHGNAEGFLFPATYDFPAAATASQILRIMIQKACVEYDSVGLPIHAKKLGLTPHQLLTVASILQAESHPRDYSKVARVILNRLAAPMRLQMDSTVAYGLNKKKVILSDRELTTATPYNTYLNDGLPPGPINNPGVQAIESAAKPANGDWLYFITTNLDTQETKFTSSYLEFLRFKDEFINFCTANQGAC